MGDLVFSNSGSNVDIFDPPATSSVSESSVLSSVTADDASGHISFADNDAAGALSASVTPDGSNYDGSFTLDQPTESNGHGSVGFDFMASDDQLNLTAGETVTQSYSINVADAQNPAENVSRTVSVTVGGPGNDHFVFAPGVGADTVTNFNPQHDTLELDHFANVHTVQELQALITTDAHGDAVIDLGHHDSITLANVTAPQLQQAIIAGHVLLH
jgi:VCBS repeat-containing protein